MPSIPDMPDADGRTPALTVSTRAQRVWRWATSMLWATLSYLLHRVPLYRRGRSAPTVPDVPDLDRDVVGDLDVVQRAADGVGPLYRRSYRIAFTDSTMTPEQVVATLRRDINAATPEAMARFEDGSADGETDPIEVGNEYVVYLPGPWNGPVRVVDADATSFTLMTLDGHMEAGQITFRARSHDRFDWTVFEIESFARSGNRLFHVLYDRVPLASEIQLHMWAEFCARVVGLAGGVVMTSVEMDTDIIEEDTDGSDGGERRTVSTAPVSDRARKGLERLPDSGLNYVLDTVDIDDVDQGWILDDWCRALPYEPVGDPVPDGPWETAARLIEDYAFVDPRIVRAVYWADVPLAERNMMLEARFYGLRFLLGLRVGDVRDDTTTVDDRPVRRWGWNYRTLEGHLETGQMDFEVWKWLDTGEVQFRIHAYSRPARITNPIVWLGMKVFGRWMQKRFARNALRRMDELVRARVGDPDSTLVAY